MEFTREQIPEFARATSEARLRGLRKIPSDITRGVAKIIGDVRESGWRSAIRYTRKFDSPTLKAERFEVSKNEIRRAEIEKHQHDAILLSIERVTRFHEAQLDVLTKSFQQTEVAFARRAWEWRIPASQESNTGFEGQRLIPIERVGLYVPGGKANYPSSVIMNAVPAKVSGVEDLMICTPPRPDGSISPAVLIAARELGIQTIVKCGGAQAIALMTFGPHGERESKKFFSWTERDKIVGPGNQWVNEAKRQLWGMVGFDTYAGPSEICILADETANPAFVASDWLTQIEHADDNVGYLVTTSRDFAEKVMAEAEEQLVDLPNQESMRRALKNHGLIVVIKKVHNEPAISTSGLAAEHVSIRVADPATAMKFLVDGGSISLGDHTPQSAGDFCAGPSHTLPTGGAARFSSPLNVMDFLKFQSISQFTKEDLAELLPTIEAFGEMEGFPQHARAARLRFEG